MANFVQDRQYLRQGDVVLVESNQKCNVRLADDQNYSKFKRGQQHQYYGSFYHVLPARIVVPSSGYWNVILELGGKRPDVNINYIKSSSLLSADASTNTLPSR
jgi:hypothetical protein